MESGLLPNAWTNLGQTELNSIWSSADKEDLNSNEIVLQSISQVKFLDAEPRDSAFRLKNAALWWTPPSIKRRTLNQAFENAAL